MLLTNFERIKIPLFASKLICVLIFIPLLSLAQTKTISGTVTDESGNPLSNISVVIKNGTGGTATDAKGHYQLNASTGSTLVFTSVNYETVNISVGNKSVYNISMKPENGGMAEVVVVGYGTQKKVNLLGSVGTVNVDSKITGRALPNISEGLTGLVPGLAATQSSGMAGRNGASLLIRGLGTPNNSSPLIVVDGIPDVDINRVNVNDIETVSVLKDASSASVYGSRAANGVILITTKSGKGMNKTVLNFSSNTALETPTKGIDFLANYPLALTIEQRRSATNTLPSNQLYKNGTIDQWMALGMIDPLSYPNTDWWNIIMRDGRLQDYNVSATGGNDKSNFFVSVGTKIENGLQIKNDYKQYNARFNFDYKLRSNMNTGVKFNGNWSNFTYALEEGFTDPASTNTAGFDMQYAIAGITPYDPATGLFGGVMAYGEDPQAYNPYSQYINSPNHQTRQEVNATAYWDWTPITGLTAGLDYNMIYYNQFNWSAPTPAQAFNFQTNAYGSRVYVGPNAPVSNTNLNGYKTLMDARVNYHTKFGSNHDLSAVFVYSEEYWNDRSLGASRNDRLAPGITEIDGALPNVYSNSGSSSAEGLRSYIGRVNYTAYNKYLLEGDMRVDGSSKFVPGQRYGYFGSGAVGWRFTEEEFLKPFLSKFLSSGKLRASYGGLGNNSGVGRYEQQTTLTANNYMIGGTGVIGLVNNKLINQSLSWESTNVFDLGLELGFLNNRLTFEMDYYDRLTKGIIQGSQLSILLTGAFSAPNTNIGNMRNRGAELTMAWRDRIGAVNYGVSVNGSYNKTRLEKWSQLLTRGATYSGNTVFIDMPYDYVYTYVDNGIAQTWADIYKNTPQGAQPGDLLRKDLNGDGRIDGNDEKALQASRNRPTTSYTLNAYASWKGIDIGMLWTGTSGRKDFWLNAFNNVNFSTSRYAVNQQDVTNPWSVENRDGEWPRIGGSGNNTAQTTFWLDDMSYLRLKNLQLGYTFPKPLFKKIGVTNFRIAGSAENLLTITSYRGLDPEKAGNNNNLYPLNKAYSLAVQLSF
ncbi:TonB-dependent receptor [Ginsengibacter hankyongi]|uniref:TonB-dependent receptor n=1 Tax=Ginsengibacter hankyongi TaxID=2607284 RepID=A0A5J5ILG5_9BACT|nr:TonB-dependent receptor [Ginsengibacter hankyongi]KAA9041388.1 TonB-dependent receptor [Ginsengibacter hankyongi]